MGHVTSQPAALSVEPASQRYTGHPVSVRVFDYGVHPIKVNSATMKLGHHCSMTHESGMTVTPASFILRSGQSKVVKVTAPAKPGDYGVLFQPSELGAGGGLTVSGAVGAQVLTGKAVSCAPPRKVAFPAHHNAGAGFSPVLAAIVAVALVVVAAIILIRRRRKV